VIVFLLAISLVAVAVLAWVYFTRPRQRSIGLDLLRIEQAEQAAIDDIRRRRQFAEDQLRRLGRWLK
jgi:hypothetical protein